MAAVIMTLIVLEGHSLLQAFSSVIFCIYGASRGPSVSAELFHHSMSSIAIVVCVFRQPLVY